MDRQTYHNDPKVVAATGTYRVLPVYRDDEFLKVVQAGRLGTLDETTLGHLRTRLDGAAMWFWLALEAHGIVPNTRTIKVLKQISERAGKVSKKAAELETLRHERGGLNGAVAVRLMERLDKARTRLNDAMGIERRIELDATVNFDQDTNADPDGMEPALREERMSLFLDSPLGRALERTGSTNHTPLDSLLNQIADPDCPHDMLRDLAEELAARAKSGAERLEWMRSIMVKPGHSGDFPLAVWLDDILNVYEQFSGRSATITVSVKQNNETMPEGPAIDFVMAAFKPIRDVFATINDAVRKENQTNRQAAEAKSLPIPDPIPLPFDEAYELQGSDAWSNRIRIAREHRRQREAAEETRNGTNHPEP